MKKVIPSLVVVGGVLILLGGFIYKPEKSNPLPTTTPTAVYKIPKESPSPTKTPPKSITILGEKETELVEVRCRQYGLETALVYALIETESNFTADIVSGTGDWGLMQINEFNHDWLREELGITDFLDPLQNIEAGLYLLKLAKDLTSNDHEMLMVYNLGLTGANAYWSEGIYSTDYSELVMSRKGKYEEP